VAHLDGRISNEFHGIGQPRDIAAKMALQKTSEEKTLLAAAL
jgi:hypothetical protein